MSVKVKEQLAVDVSSSLLKRVQAYAFGSRHQFIEDGAPATDSSQDILANLKNNISQLENVSQRLDFMMDEVASLIKKRR